MDQMRKTRQKKPWKLITIWLLMIMLAVTMAVPSVSFADGDSSAKDKKESKSEKETKKDKKSKDKKSKKKKKKKKANVYRVERTEKGVLKCWYYDKDGKKSEHSETDAYFIVKFDKGTKDKGTARKKIGKKGKLYYFNEKHKGEKYTGWYQKGKKKYYFKKGKRFRGIKKVDKTWYEFSDENGRLWRKIGDKMDRKMQYYTSNTKYLVAVNLKKHQTRVYKGSKKDWKRIHKWKCVTGKSATPTVKGTFAVGTRGKFFDTGSYKRCWYYTQIYGNYFFHSVPYDRKSKPVKCLDSEVGVSKSRGCIRLKLKNAKWIYNHIPRGTKVVIY